MSSVKLALQARQARALSIDALRADPVAIIGMACRLPGGADTPDRLWSLLREGRDSAGPVPADRWDAARWYDADLSTPGKSITPFGSFLQTIDAHGIAGFDAGYFGIASREAERMDPQQRLLLEVAYEALDDAGVDQRALAGSRTGLFVASYHNDYARMQYADPEGIELRSLTGTLHSVLASRMAYLLDLRGPALAVDTACSASLVAIHLACQSLRWGESDMALAGGVSLMLAPELMVMLSKLGFMAPDGRSKTFDAAADGFGRGEGCGVLVLKRLSDAVAAGDRVWAVIRGSAVNQDGRSTLLTAPNGPAQEALIREALAAAQVEPGRIGLVETHGTGTALGDAIEMEAIAAVLGTPEGVGPCWLGGLKANIGHLEAAAGVAGVIKAVLALRHGEIPPQPNFAELNPAIKLAGTRLAIPTRSEPWTAVGAQPRCAAVSAFGVGGTNAHVILEEAPTLPIPAAPTGDPAWLLPLSAKTPAALTALATRWVDVLEDTAPVADLCHSASRRTQHDHRMAVVGRTPAELRGGVRRWLQEAASPVARAMGVAFVFCGQGPQWFAMGRKLLATEPVFRDAILGVESALTPLAGWRLVEELSRDQADSRLDQTQFAQPILFALQIALAALWRAWGVAPDVVVGHSVGEIAALHVAGLLALPDAVRLVFHRGRIMQRATGYGRMASVALSEGAARALIGPRLSIAAINGPRSVVLSGEADALEAALAAHPDAAMLPVNCAFHSAQMDPLRDAFVAAIGDVRTHPANIPVISTVTGARAELGLFDASYFGRNMRDTVRFADAMAALPPGMAIVEIAPHPVLSHAIAACLDGKNPVIAASLRRGRPERETMLRAAASLFAAGVLAAPARVQPGRGRVVSLPSYPWQRQRHWLPALSQVVVGCKPPTLRWPSGHPLIGQATRVAGTDIRVHALSASGGIRDWLDQHLVLDQVLVPGAAVMEAFLAAGAAALGGQASLSDFAVHRPIVVGRTAALCQGLGQITVRPAAGSTGFEVAWFEAAEGAEPWQCVASATAQLAEESPKPLATAPAVSSCDAAALYDRFAALGVPFGSDFRLLNDITWAPGAATATVTLPERLDAAEYGIHPVLLDAAVQLCSVAAGPDDAGALPRGLYLPVGAAHVALHAATPFLAMNDRPLSIRARMLEDSADSILCDADILQTDGVQIATVRRLRLARAAPDRQLLHDLAWEQLPAAERLAEAGPFLLLVDAGGVAEAVATELPGRVLQVHAGAAFARPAEDVWQIDPAIPEQFATMLRQASWQGGTLVHCWSLDTPPGEPAGGDDIAGLGAMLHLAQVMQAGRMVVVTRGAQTIGTDSVGGVCPQAATLWGLAGVIRAEEPALGLRMIDLDPAGAGGLKAGAAGLLAELLAADAAASVALRGGHRLRPVLRRYAPLVQRDDRDRRLVLRQPGTFDGLGWEAATPTAPASGEVRVRVHAAGLNFRDVLLTLGMYPGGIYPGRSMALGAECAGVVEAAGDGAPFVTGQRVFGCVDGALGGVVTVPSAFLAAMPDDMRMREAAALPVAFLTGLYGLDRLARLRAGESVLIHAAAGGVGLAAVQIAQRAGAQVFATAGSPAKRALLGAMGVAGVFDSRSLGFADDVLAATCGRGVDVVLNSLAGDFIPAGLRALAPGGRFLELGKRDVWSDADIAAVRPDVRYFLYDLGAATKADPRLLAPMFAELLGAFADGALRALPVMTFPLAEAASAMRMMAQARHVGKIVLQVAEEPARPMPVVRPNATYWITGGLSGVGLETASWLVGQGARHLLLSGRTAPDFDAQARITALVARGARVTVRLADAGDEAAMQAVLDDIDPVVPLRGVIHAAGVLRDGVLATQNWEAAAETLRGKLRGAWVLHRLTRRTKLDFFVLYSAAGVLLGAPGQGLYPAANAGLDALARYRRRLGLPALSVAWGSLGGVGMAARMTEGADVWCSRGLRPIDLPSGFAGLQRLMADAAAYGVVLDADWPHFMATLPQGIDRAFFAQLGIPSAGLSRAAPPPVRDALAALRGLPPAGRRAGLVAFLRAQTLAIIGLDPATHLDAGRPLKEIGLDSLMAVELRNGLVRTGGRRLPATLLFDYPSLDRLAGYLMTAWNFAELPRVAALPSVAEITHEAVTAMTEAEAEAMLLAELGTGAAA